MKTVDKHTFFEFSKKLIVFISLSLILFACSNEVKVEEVKPKDKNSQITKEAEFVGSKTCVACHQEEFKAWDGSHHQQAMKIADSTSILGDFNNTSFTNKGIKTSFFTKDTEYWVNTEGPDGEYQNFRIAYTFGVFPLQQYLVEFPNGAFQCLLTAWDAKANKWYDLQPKLKISHKEWMHWSGGSMTWNTMCADCHSTNLQKNYDNQTSTYKTTFSEINVSCEACHGPSSLHNSFHQNPNENTNAPKLKMTKGLSSKELVDQCARCHSRRAALTKKFDYQGHFLDHYSPALLTAPNYELDGQIKEEDYVYGSFIQSKMYHNGVSCKDCHNSHTLALRETGNNLCLSCHETKYDSEKHHFHQEKTEGALCVNCHMTGKTYMGNDFRRDHSFRIPRPDQSVKYDTPNACTNCHEDKSNKWASEVIIDKYGAERTDHFSDHLLAGVNGDKNALHHLISHNTYPEIARATALNYYSNYSLNEENIADVISFLTDSSALVRNEAVKLLEKFGQQNFASILQPLLMDSVRLVRISSAQALNSQTYEYLEELAMNSDFASGQYHIAINHEMNKRFLLAKAAYEKSLRIDNYFNASRMNLALLVYKQGNANQAEKLYLKVIEQEPDFGESYYMLGLLNNEKGNTELALSYMKTACEKQTTNYKPFYNYALMLQAKGDIKSSVTIINKGLEIYPYNEQLLYVKLTTELNQKEYPKAKKTMVLLLQIDPNNQNYVQIAQQLTNK